MKKTLFLLLFASLLTSCAGFREGFNVRYDKCGNKTRSHMPPSVRLDGSK